MKICAECEYVEKPEYPLPPFTSLWRCHSSEAGSKDQITGIKWCQEINTDGNCLYFKRQELKLKVEVRKPWWYRVKAIKWLLIFTISLAISGCYPKMVTLLPSEKAALTAYNQAFYNNSRESDNDYHTQVNYVLHSFGNQERLKKAWAEYGYPEAYPWKDYQAVMVPSSITKGPPEIWGVLHRSVPIGLTDYDKPHIFSLWHEQYHIMAEGDLTLLYPDSDPSILDNPIKDPRDPRDTEDKILKMAHELFQKGFITIPKDQWEMMNANTENYRRQIKRDQIEIDELRKLRDKN